MVEFIDKETQDDTVLKQRKRIQKPAGPVTRFVMELGVPSKKYARYIIAGVTIVLLITLISIFFVQYFEQEAAQQATPEETTTL